MTEGDKWRDDRRALLKRVAGFGVLAPALYLLRTRSARAAAPIFCFLRGTAILTLHGEVAVERLAAGDSVVTPGGPSVVRWIGTRSFPSTGKAIPTALAPVRIARGALADNAPSRDLSVSPEHKLLIDDVFVTARDLLNGSTVTQVSSLAGHEALDYFHIELDRHDCVLAEGTWAETFRVTGANRERFSNFATAPGVGSPFEQAPYAPTVGFDGLRSVARYAAGMIGGRADASQRLFRAIRARVADRAKAGLPVA